MIFQYYKKCFVFSEHLGLNPLYVVNLGTRQLLSYFYQNRAASAVRGSVGRSAAET